MPVANLANIPNDVNSMNEWAFSLQAQIRDINRTIFQESGTILPEYSMDPFNIDEPYNQLLQFQEMANNISAVLGVPGYDFEDVDLTDDGQRASWTWLVFVFMKQASDQIGVG